MQALAVDLERIGFRRDDRWILDELSWQVKDGTCAALLGPNGCGKSTLARIIAGHMWPTRGSVKVLGQTFGEVDLHELRKSLRLVQSTSPVEMDPDLTAREVAVTGYFGTLGLYDPTTPEMHDHAAEVLDRVGLHHVATHRYTTLSNGERMRCLIARALVVRPRLLLLDEPTAGLDLLAREQVLATIQALFDSDSVDPPTVLFITHHLEELPPATSNVLLMDNGKVAAQGLPRNVLTAANLSPVYGCPIKVSETGGRFYAQVHPDAWSSILRRK